MTELMWELERKIKHLQKNAENICDYEKPCELIKILDLGINSVRVNDYFDMYYKTDDGKYIHDNGQISNILKNDDKLLKQNVYFKYWDRDADDYIILMVSTKPIPEDER